MKIQPNSLTSWVDWPKKVSNCCFPLKGHPPKSMKSRNPGSENSSQVNVNEFSVPLPWPRFGKCYLPPSIGRDNPAISHLLERILRCHLLRFTFDCSQLFGSVAKSASLPTFNLMFPSPQRKQPKGCCNGSKLFVGSKRKANLISTNKLKSKDPLPNTNQDMWMCDIFLWFPPKITPCSKGPTPEFLDSKTLRGPAHGKPPTWTCLVWNFNLGSFGGHQI